MKKRVLAFFLMLALLLCQGQSAFADAVAGEGISRIVLTLGADLTEEQRQYILQYFSISQDQVKTVVITNQDERSHLGNLMSEDKIGTRTLSCALIRLTSTGGVQVKTANMNYVTSQMISTTLVTSGINNCEVLTAAPFEVSGTGALTGVMMAYEAATGAQLDASKKELANEELILTGDLAETVGQDQATLVVNDIKIHIVRDQVTEEEEIRAVVDEVVTTTQEAAEEAAAVKGEAPPATLGQVQHESLYDYGNKVSRQNYEYREMQRTLEWISYNAAKNAGIHDPLTDTFTTLEDEIVLDEDSILLNTNDGVLGEEAKINATIKASLGEHEAEEIEVATGDAVLTSAGTVKAQEFIQRTNLVSYRDVNGFYTLMDLNGNKMTESIYEDSFRGEYGMVKARLGDNSGRMCVLSANGQILVPADYFYVEILGDHWAVGYTMTEGTQEDYDFWAIGTYRKMDQAHLYYIEGDEATVAAVLSRDLYERVNCSGAYINIKDRSGVITTYGWDGAVFNAYGTTDSLGDFGEFDDDNALRASLRQLYGYNVDRFYKGYARAWVGGSYGLVDRYGNEILPFQYERVDLAMNEDSNAYVSGGYVGVSLNGNFGYVTQGGVVTASYSYSFQEAENGGMAAYVKTADNAVHLLSGDGVESDLGDGYDRVSPIAESKGLLWKCRKASDGSFDLVDWHGNLLLSGAEDYSVSANGNYLIAQDGYTSSTLYLVNGSSMVGLAESEGGASELKTEAREGASLTAYTGDPMLTKQGKTIDGNFLSDCDLLIQSQNALYSLYDLDGSQLTDKGYTNLSYEQGYIITKLDEGDTRQEGLMTADGAEIIPCEFDMVYVLSPKWAVSYRVEETSIEEEADYYRGDTLLAISEARIYYITSEDVSYVTLSREMLRDVAAWGEYVNVKDRTTGKVTTYDNTFTAVTAANSLSDFGTVNPDAVLQKQLKDQLGYSFSTDFLDGYAQVYKDGKYGLVDMSGAEILPLAYDVIRTTNVDDEPHNVVNGYFSVKKEGKYGLVSIGAQGVLELLYPEDEVYTRNAMSLVLTEEDGTYTLISGDGKESKGYDSLNAQDDLGLFYTARRGDDSFLIDWHGNVLFENYNRVRVSETGRYLIAKKGDEDDVILYEVSLEK